MSRRDGLQHGVTLIELMVTIAIAAILLSVAVPMLGQWINSGSVSAAAEALQNGVRTAQAEAIKRNALVEFMLTSNVPVYASGEFSIAGIEPELNGKNWVVRTVTGPTYIAHFDNTALAEGLAVTGPASIVFNGFGRVFAGDAETRLGEDQLFCVAHDSSSKELCVLVTAGASVRLCDPDKPSADSRSCPVLADVDADAGASQEPGTGVEGGEKAEGGN